MKNVLFLFFLILTSGTLLFSQDNYSLKSKNFTVAGTSNLHDWESEVEDVKLTGKFGLENGVLKSVSDVAVNIAVSSIKSSKGSIMDSKTHNALNYKKYPNITYKLTKVNSIETKGSSFVAHTTGNLTIAGSTKAIDMDVTVKPNGANEIEISGLKKIKMTTFGVKPPTAMMGALTTGDDVTIKFTIKVGKQ
jgi:polyisoprenoid-binding protein YceI